MVVDVIRLINKEFGNNILLIDDTYYLVSKFTPAEEKNGIYKHYVKGRDVTKILDNNSSIVMQGNNNSVRPIVNAMEDLPEVVIEYSPNHSWKLYSGK